MNCPNCNRSFRAGGNGLAFHLTWCKPAEPVELSPIAPAVPMARCGSTVAHGGHAVSGPVRYCVGNVNVVTAVVAEPEPTPEPTVPRAPRGRKLTRKERRARLSALLARPAPVQKAQKSPAVKGPKLPAVGAGKHSRCVAHIPMVRTAPGLAYACFDVTPDADAIAERQTFVAVLDASWNVAHDAYVSRLAPEPTDAARALVGRLGPDLYTSRRLTGPELVEFRTHVLAQVAAHNARYGETPNAVAYSVAA